MTSTTRSALMPDVAPIAEAGLKGYETGTWHGILAPAATPKDVVAKLNAEIVKILAQPDVREKLIGQGLDPVGGTPEQFAAYHQVGDREVGESREGFGRESPSELTHGAQENRYMMQSMKRPLLLVASLFAAVAAGAVNAQTYPARPVRFIVPFSPGGASDTAARIIGNKLGERWGQQVVIENRPGAGGTIGTEIASKAQPDGYTLLMGSSTELASNPNLYTNLKYDTTRAFTPIALLTSTPLIVAVHPIGAGAVREGARRAGEGEARTVELRVIGQRIDHAARRRNAQARRRHRDAARAVHRQRARGREPARRPDAD